MMDDPILLKEVKSSSPASQRYELAMVCHLFALPVTRPILPTPTEAIPPCNQNTKCVWPQNQRTVKAGKDL